MIQLPTECPVCKSKLVWKGVDLVCDNPDCENRKQADLEIWTDILGEIENLKWLTKKKYLYQFKITSVEELNNFIKNDIDESKFNSITDMKVLNMFFKIRDEEFSLAKGLQALNIERLGEESSKKIAMDKDSYILIMGIIKNNNYNIDYSFDCIEKVVGPATTRTLIENIDKLQRLNFIKIKSFEEKLTSAEKGTFCITGKLNSGTRDSIIKLAEDKGWRSLKSVNKECDYLVTNDTTSGSSKNKKAQQLGTKIINENQFLDLINK